MEWAKIYGGDAWDEAFKVAETTNGDLILAGYTKAQEKHLWIIKLDEQGFSKWGKTYKAKPESQAKGIVISKDSNIVAAGFSVKPYQFQSDLWILKLDKDGNELWDKNYGGDGEEAANDLIETSDLGYAMSGYSTTNESYNEDAWVLKLDSAGNKLWDRTFGGDKADYAYGIAETSDKGLVVCGTTSSRGESYKAFWVAKMDSAGNDLWDEVYPFNKWDVATSVTQGLDDFIYVTGYTRTYSIIDYDIILIKLDQNGKVIWTKTHSWGRWDQATSITSTFDNGIAVAGFTRSGEVLSSDFAVTKFDEEGNILWENIFARRSLDYANDIKETRDNGLSVCGTTYMQGRGWDFALLKFANEDQPVISFNQDSVSTSIKEIFNLKACIKVKSNLKNIQILFNDSLIVNNANKNAIRTESVDCDIPLKTILNLKRGENKVEIVLTDYKEHQVRKDCKIFFIPPSEVIW
ncbi:MAG: hypothetical protein JXA16_09010 [Bacteroidales bacterium]|nr:hypothetical protein [Bacteroidales bacterium]